jgi:hypothetical protein
MKGTGTGAQGPGLGLATRNSQRETPNPVRPHGYADNIEPVLVESWAASAVFGGLMVLVVELAIFAAWEVWKLVIGM